MTLTVQLSEFVEGRLRAKALAEGKPVEEIAANLLASVIEPVSLPNSTEDWLDEDYHAECSADTSSIPTLEEVRAITSKLPPGSLTAAFIAEREER